MVHSEKSELHVLILWHNARDFKNQAESLLNSKFTVRAIVKRKWSKKYALINFSRFYQKSQEFIIGKVEHVGYGPFFIYLLEDKHPIYDLRLTSSGFKNVNTNVFDLKQKMRELTGGGHLIHASDDTQGARRDLYLLFHKDPNDLSITEYLKSIHTSLHLDLLGSQAWADLPSLFKFLNACTNYVVLRNYSNLPLKVDSEHSDIDVLTDNFETFKYLLNGNEVFKESYRVHLSTSIGGVQILWDIRSTNDFYYDANWARNILKKRIKNENLIFIPDNENNLWSLIYHALVHKKELNEDYLIKYKNLYYQQFNLNPHLSSEAIITELASFMSLHNYSVVKPKDRSVYFSKVAEKIQNRICVIKENLTVIHLLDDGLKLKKGEKSVCFVTNRVPAKRLNLLSSFLSLDIKEISVSDFNESDDDNEIYIINDFDENFSENDYFIIFNLVDRNKILLLNNPLKEIYVRHLLEILSMESNYRNIYIKNELESVKNIYTRLDHKRARQKTNFPSSPPASNMKNLDNLVSVNYITFFDVYQSKSIILILIVSDNYKPSSLPLEIYVKFFANEILFKYQLLLFENERHTIKNIPEISKNISQNFILNFESREYIYGESLLDQIHDLLRSSQLESALTMFEFYIHTLKNLFEKESQKDFFSYDVVLSNLIIDNEAGLNSIDREWLVSSKACNLTTFLIRNIYFSILELSQLKDIPEENLINFYQIIFTNNLMNLELEQLLEFATLESELQSFVSNNNRNSVLNSILENSMGEGKFQSFARSLEYNRKFEFQLLSKQYDIRNLLDQLYVKEIQYNLLFKDYFLIINSNSWKLSKQLRRLKSKLFKK